MIMHKHHYPPQHRVGKHNNVMWVTVEEHAELHLDEYLTYGLKEDWLAYRGLAGIIGHEEAVREAQRLGVSKANAERVWTDEGRAKISQQNKKRGAKIHCVELNKTWLCAKDAGEELGLKPKGIYSCARGEMPTYKGLHFKRVVTVEPRRNK